MAPHVFESHLKRTATMKRSALAVLGFFLLCGCSQLKPWVKPYERGNLADPIMALEGAPISAKYMGHVYEARESARGAEGGAGGGCGCN